MKKVFYILIPMLLIALVVFKLKTNKEIAQNKVYHYDKEKPINVLADTLMLRNIQTNHTFSGIFQANKETQLSAEIQGKVNALLVDVGSRVHKGQPLIYLDKALLEKQLNTLNVQIQNLHTENEIQLKNNQLQIDQLQTDVDRLRILAAADAVQKAQLEKAELQLNIAKTQQQSILQQSALKNAQAQKASIEEQIKKTIVYAPFSGIITAKRTEVGAFAAPGIPLMEITDIASLKFTITVPENDLSLFELNKKYPIVADAFPQDVHSSTLTMIAAKGNAANSFPLQFSIKNTKDLKLKAGMSGKVVFKKTLEPKGIIIPSSSILNAANQAQVYLIKNGKATLQNISISKRIGNNTVIEKGLNEGDILITGGFINLFENANVSAKK